MHTTLGPGLLESAYKACLAYELKSGFNPLRLKRRRPAFAGRLHHCSGTYCGYTSESAWLPFGTAVTHAGCVDAGKGVFATAFSVPSSGVSCAPETELSR